VKFKEAQDFKAAGNVLFKEDKFMEALEEYTKALRYIKDYLTIFR